MNQSNALIKFELSAVLVTAVAKFLFMDFLNWRLLFTLTAIAFWVAYVIWRYKKDASVLSFWGFQKNHFGSVFKLLAPFGIFSIIAFLLIGYNQGTINVTWHIIPIFLLYPIWGVIQQFLVVGIVAGNLNIYPGIHINKWVIILITSTLFAAVHYPYWWLVVGTFILALLYSYIYLQKKNLFALGLYHGWLGAIFFYTVVGRDPWVEVFGVF